MQIQKPKQGYKLVKSLFGKYEEIPNDWNLIPLNDVTLEHKQGFYTNQTYSKIGIKLVRITDLQNPSLDYGSMPLLELNKKDIEDFKVNKGDFLFARSGTIGRFGIATEDTPCVFGSYIIRFVFDSTKILNEYFGYFYQTDYVKKQLNAIQQGSSNININAENIKHIKVKLPKISEQQKISLILSNVDSLIQQTREGIEQTQRLKKGLMQKLLTKGIGHTKFKVTKFGAYFIRAKTPESWKISTVKNSSEKLVVGFVGTCEPYYVNDGGIPLLRTTNVKEGEFDLSNLKYITREFHERNKKSQVKEGDILVSRHGENGEACLVRNITEANCLNVVIIRPKKDLFLPEFFELAFNSYIVRRQIQRTTGGGVQDVVNTSEIGKAKIIIPDLNEQGKIVSIFNDLRFQIQKQQENKSQLETLKKGLMQKLLTGQIRVKI